MDSRSVACGVIQHLLRKKNRIKPCCGAYERRLTLGQNKRVLTVIGLPFRQKGKRAFVSISVDVDKLIDYIVDKEIPNQGAYVIVDSQGQVLMDTTDTLYEQTITLPEKTIGCHFFN